MNFSKLFLQDLFQSLTVIDPFEDTQHFFDGNDFKPFDLEFLFGALGIIFEYFIDDVEQFFYSLIQSHILSAFH